MSVKKNVQQLTNVLSRTVAVVVAATATATTSIECENAQVNETSEMCINIFCKRNVFFFLFLVSVFVRGQEEKHICWIFMYRCFGLCVRFSYMCN